MLKQNEKKQKNSYRFLNSRRRAGDREEKNCQTPNPGFRTGKQKPEMQKQQENRQVNYRVRKTSWKN